MKNDIKYTINAVPNTLIKKLESDGFKNVLIRSKYNLILGFFEYDMRLEYNNEVFWTDKIFFNDDTEFIYDVLYLKVLSNDNLKHVYRKDKLKKIINNIKT